MPVEEMLSRLSDQDRADLQIAIRTLKGFGAQEVYLFGSMARGDSDESSDWDFGVRLLPSENYFQVLGELLTCLHREADLVDLFGGVRFGEMLEQMGELVRVA